MRRLRGFRIVLALCVVMVLALVAVMQVAATVAQTTASRTVGSSTVPFSDDWLLDQTVSNSENILLTHQRLPTTLFLYAEYPNSTTLNTGIVLEESVMGFFNEFGDGNQQIVATGTMNAGLDWRLYSVDQIGVPYGFMVTADITSQPGWAKATMLVAPAGSFDIAVEAVMETIIAGAESPLAGFDPAELDATLSGTARLDPTPTPVQTQPQATSTPAQTDGLTLPPINPTTVADAHVLPTEASGGLTLPALNPTTTPDPQAPPTEASSGLTLPPLNPPPTVGSQTTGGGEISVAGQTIRYGGGWVYSEENSTPGEIAFFLLNSQAMATYAYAVFDNPGGADGITALGQFNEGFFSSLGAVDVESIATETLPSGLAYTLHTGVLSGEPTVVLAYADVISAPGNVRVQVLMANTSEFESVFADARVAFTIDDVMAFIELDPAAVSAHLGGGASVLAALATTNEIIVGSQTIRYGEGWSYAEETSTPGEIAFFNLDTAIMVAYAYASFGDDSGGDVAFGLGQFNSGFFSSFGAENVQSVALETLPSGHAWSLHTGTLNGAPIVVLAYADVTTTPGDFRVQVLMTRAAEFDDALVNVRQTFQIDGLVAFSDLDPASVSGRLGSGGYSVRV